MKVLVLGARGMLGQDLVPVLLQAGHMVVSADRAAGAGSVPLDITDLDRVQSVMADVRPEAVINAAAYTDVDGAEADQESAYRVNALGTWNLALSCQAYGIPLMYVSTDYVFDGTKGGAYDEYDTTSPQSVYGLSKRAGELHVERLCRKYYIVRTSWLYGHGGKNFVQTILKAGSERPELRVVNDQWGCPTATTDLAEAMVRLLESNRFGTFHVTGQGECTWFDFAAEILRLGGLSTPIYPQTTAELNRPAPRPAYSVLRNRALELTGQPLLPHWKDSVRRFVAQHALPAALPHE